MTVKKKKYLAPEINVVEIAQTEIICLSGDTERITEGEPIFEF